MLSIFYFDDWDDLWVVIRSVPIVSLLILLAKISIIISIVMFDDYNMVPQKPNNNYGDNVCQLTLIVMIAHYL